jgi:Putative metal-binding motif/Regulator of chromosome condensation (RCC1) repeat
VQLPERRRVQRATRLQLQRALSAALALCALWAAGCADGDASTSASAQAASPSGAGVFLDPCSGGADCENGLCLALATGSGVCTHACTRHAECPGGENWACSGTAETSGNVCVCAADARHELCGDGRDNDCDGKLDDCLACGARLVAPDDRLNCGSCGHACGAGELCRRGVCACPEGAECGGDEGAVCSEDGECDDGIACTRDACVAGSCVPTLDEGACGAGTSCDPRADACVAGPVCELDADCRDQDPCTVHERCEPSSRRCVYEVLDGDGDGHPPVVCGGLDCDDLEREVAPGAAELCDGRDDDCDGQVDEAPASDACGDRMACVLGSCACAGGTVECDHACRSLASDPAHCGACGNACAPGTVCDDGQCTCAASQLACQGECRSRESFAADPLHCGSCGNACAASEVCSDGECTCASGASLCGGLCVDEPGFASERAHCGSCGVRCDAACLAGSCAVPRDVVAGFASTCVLFEDGRAACVGRVGGTAPRPLLGDDGLPVTGITRLVLNDIAPAPYLCALLEGGRLLCGGDALLRGTRDPLALEPVYVRGMEPLSDVAEVVLGADASCALGKGGQLWCWGPNLSGAVGAGEAGESALALPVRDANGTPLSHVVKVAALPLVSQVCALGAAGELWCWGGNGRGEAVPNGASELRMASRVLAADGRSLPALRDVAVAAGASCALTEAGSALCWGDASHGLLGHPGLGLGAVVDQAGRTLTGAVALHGAYGGFCVLGAAGQLSCWGANALGQLGDGSTSDRAYAVPVLGGVRELALSLGHRCALRGGGELLCWGDDASHGSALAGALTLFAQPVRDDAGRALAAVRAVSVGAQHSCVLDGRGQVSCWGESALGQLGLGGGALRPRAFAWP